MTPHSTLPDESVVPFLLLQAKRALMEAGADAHDVSDALFCYHRGISSGQTVRDAVIWSLRFFYLLRAATRQAEGGLMAQVAIRAAYERIIRDKTITGAATAPAAKAGAA